MRWIICIHPSVIYTFYLLFYVLFFIFVLEGHDEHRAAGARVLVDHIAYARDLHGGQVSLAVPAGEGARELVAAVALQGHEAFATEGVADRARGHGLAHVTRDDGGRLQPEESVDGRVVVVHLGEPAAGAVLAPLVSFFLEE